ncbi:hypothetical protein ZWY2020_011840 [Hordeum vulgare]|nr:hypothetical protein ZWY2020_011840 [Hordeum vulgare]
MPAGSLGNTEGGGEEGRRRCHRAGTKEIYARLSRPVSFDDDTKEFWLEKSKGRVCMALSSKALVITAIDDRRYWTHMPTTESISSSVFSSSLAMFSFSSNNLLLLVSLLESPEQESSCCSGSVRTLAREPMRSPSS